MADANEMMAAFAKGGVEYARKLNKRLDYSEESIRQVEDICAALYNETPKGFFNKLFQKPPPEETIIHISKILGAYIGEVMLKHYGGNWSIENFMDQGKIPIVNIGDLKTFPVGKVYKRLKNGPEDNVYHYYQVMTKDLQRIN